MALLDEAQAILEPLAQTWPTYHYHLACCLALRMPPAVRERGRARGRGRADNTEIGRWSS